LYRLSRSAHADRFVLKGAALLLLWLDETTRPTKDIDLLGLGDTSADGLKLIFVDLCQVVAPEDGLTFLPETVQVQANREAQDYGGMRVTLMATLGNSRIPLQVDIGAGDAVVPPPDIVEYPGLLDLPRAHLRVYRPETSIAEKTEAMVRLALANTRMKDFFDILGLSEARAFDGDTLRLAVAATFARRQVALPSEMPLALTAEFSEHPQKRLQWAASVRRTRHPERVDLTSVVDVLAGFLWPVLRAAARDESWLHLWEPGGHWKRKEP
jgi:hypothetical protein